jgi:hypothetical protein
MDGGRHPPPPASCTGGERHLCHYRGASPIIKRTLLGHYRNLRLGS